MSIDQKKRPITWCAIGDSFTYLDSHLDETGYRLHRGYLTRTLELLPAKIRLINLGINGSATSDWLAPELPAADFYTVLLGTNDWFSRHTPLGTEADFQNGNSGSILGNLRLLIECIRSVSPEAPVFVMNPVERGEFVYLFDFQNHAHGSDRPENGLWLKDVAEQIFTCVGGQNIIPIDLHTRCGFTPENAVHFKRVLRGGKTAGSAADLTAGSTVNSAADLTMDLTMDLTYADYCHAPEFNPDTDPYPYPEEAIYMTYDGLHPSDEGAQIIAEILSREIRLGYSF